MKSVPASPCDAREGLSRSNRHWGLGNERNELCASGSLLRLCAKRTATQCLPVSRTYVRRKVRTKGINCQLTGGAHAREAACSPVWFYWRGGAENEEAQRNAVFSGLIAHSSLLIASRHALPGVAGRRRYTASRFTVHCSRFTPHTHCRAGARRPDCATASVAPPRQTSGLCDSQCRSSPPNLQ